MKSLADHLKQPDRVAETALVIANSVEIQHYQPFIESLQVNGPMVSLVTTIITFHDF